MATEIQTNETESLRNILDSTPASILIIGAEGLFIDGNKASYTQFGVKNTDELIGHSMFEFSPEKQNNGANSKEEIKKYFEQALSGNTVTFEWEITRIDERNFPCQVTLKSIRYNGHTCLMATFIDTTVLQDKAAWYESILDAVPMAITVTDLDSKWTFVNKAVENMLNRKRSELIGHPCNEWGANICNTQNCGISRLKKGFTNTTFEQSGGYFKVDCAFVTNIKGEKVGHVEVVGDITQETKITQYLRKEVDHLAKNLEKLAAGDINCNYDIVPPDEHTKEVAALFIEINKDLKEANNAISLMIADTTILSKAAVEGRLDTRADQSKHKGEFRKIVQGINETLDAVINPLNVAVEYVDRISKGDIPSKITDSYNGDFNGIKNNLNRCIDAVNLLVSDAKMLANAAVNGALDTRADVSKHQGDFQVVVKGVNNTLDAVIGPLNVAAEYVDRISKGDIPSKITDSYNGDFNAIKNNLNSCIDGLQGLVQANKSLQLMAVNDHTLQLTGSYQGIFAEVATAVNLVQERVNHIAQSIHRISLGDLSELEAYKKIGSRSEHDLIVPGFIRVFETLKTLVSDANMLANAAKAGKLEIRADVSRHQGDYRKIVEGVNETLDSVIVPVKEALRVSKEYSNYQFRTRVDTSLQIDGDWIEFKNALDNIGIQVSNAVGIINTQIIDLASNAEEATASIEEVSAGAQQIAQSAGEVSKNAELGNDGIFQVLKAMEDLNITVGEVSQRAEQVSSLAIQANEFSKIGIDLAKKSESSMIEMTHSSSEVDQIINEINTQMADIGKIVRLITDIANQTNLLALNAAIEAARAGEAGRGFAVVAAEVKSLAQDSRKSAEDIADMISTLQDKAQKATTAMDLAGKTIGEGSKSLSETLDAFHKIANSIDNITQNAMNVASASEEQAASVEEVTASINEVSGLLQNTSKDAGDAAAATEEASASIEQISKVVSNVSGIAESVSREMSKFIV